MSRMVRHYRIWNGAAEGGPLEPDQDALDGIGLDLPRSSGVPARKAGAKGMPRCRTESTTSRSRSARPSLPSRNWAGVSSEESPDKQAWWGRCCIAAPGSTGISIIDESLMVRRGPPVRVATKPPPTASRSQGEELGDLARDG